MGKKFLLASGLYWDAALVLCGVSLLIFFLQMFLPRLTLAGEPEGSLPTALSAPSVRELRDLTRPAISEGVAGVNAGQEHLLAGSLPSTASKYSVIPLPAIGFNRNEGFWGGGLSPIIYEKLEGDVDKLVVPQYLYNSKVGHYGTLNLFGYPSDTEQYHGFIWYGEHVDRGIDLGYKNVHLEGGRFFFSIDINAFKNPFARFFGIGSTASEKNETNFTSREFSYKMSVGINLTPDWLVLFTERAHLVRIEEGLVGSLPSVRTLFSNVAGLDGADILGHGLSLRYDTRDSQLVATRGAYVNFYGEFVQNLHSDNVDRWGHYLLDARKFLSHAPHSWFPFDGVFVMRGKLEGVIGQIAHEVSAGGTNTMGIPFYELPQLGGEDSLRGFGRSRFTGALTTLLNLEERLNVTEVTMFGHDLQLELAPFLDLGRVNANRLRAERLVSKNIQWNPGLGFRVKSSPFVVTRLDIGSGKEGPNVFLGLDYPF